MPLTPRARNFGRRAGTPFTILAILAGTAGLATTSASAASAASRASSAGTVVTSHTADSAGTTDAARASATAASATATSATVRVIVRGVPGSMDAVIRLVHALHGQTTRNLPIIDGVAATVPGSAVAALRASTGILAVTPDATGHVLAVNPSLGYDAGTDTGSLDLITKIVGARSMWSNGFTGKGVDVALIDTGVAQVPGLSSGNVVNGPDLSIDSPSSNLRYLDGFGHGTHMASIIAGRDEISTPAGYASTSNETSPSPSLSTTSLTSTTSPTTSTSLTTTTSSTGKYDGIAPDARVISLKVGATDGAADVSQVIAAINWVTQHAHDPGLNIRVLNLSYGTSSTQDYRLDPLSYAVDVAWRKGIAVVVAAGNDGTSKLDLSDPALNPNVIAVGAEDPQGTVSTLDDTVPDFSNRGTKERHVDVVAPGVHVLGLRVPGSIVDQENPSAAVGTRFIRGSGTSQATAVTSGVLALLLSARPNLTPDQAKWAISTSATPLVKGTTTNRGFGLINAQLAFTVAGPALPSPASLITGSTYATGTGSLEGARGSAHLTTAAGDQLIGERDIFAAAWDGRSWASAVLGGTSWARGSWRGNPWSGSGWSSSGDWSAATWTVPSWSGNSWADSAWTGRTWVAGAWSGRTWVSTGWFGRTWVDQTWSSTTWS